MDKVWWCGQCECYSSNGLNCNICKGKKESASFEVDSLNLLVRILNHLGYIRSHTSYIPGASDE